MEILPRSVLYPQGWRGSGLLAQTDWATGCIRWFLPYLDFERLQEQLLGDVSAIDQKQWCLLETFGHEAAHVLQMTSTGFAYSLSRRLFSIVRAGFLKWKLLEEINEHRGEYTDELRSTLETLDRAGGEGVTPRAILEGLAFVQQKKFAYHDLTLNDFVSFLDAEVDDRVYRSAFDIAVKYLGANASDMFIHVANLSLYTQEPETVFVPLLKEFASRASRLNWQSNQRLGTDFLARKFPGMILGTAESQMNAGRSHPALASNVLEVATYAHLKVRNYAKIYAGSLNNEIVRLLRTTAYFAPTSDGQTPIIPSDADLRINDGGMNMSTFRYLNAVSDILQQDLPDPESKPVAMPASEMGSAVSDVATRLLIFVVDRKSVRSSDEREAVCRRLEGLGSTPQYARSSRGMVVLSFEDSSGWLPDLMDEDVRACLRYFFDRLPHLIYFLLKDDQISGHTLNFAWAAYAPDEQVRVGDGRVGIRMSEHAIDVAVRAIRAAADYAVQQGEARTTMLVHVEGLPATAAREVRWRVFGY